MSCSRVNHLLSAYIDNELPGVEQMMVRQHLRQCDACRDEYESLLWTKRLLSSLSAQKPSPGFENHLLEVIAKEEEHPAQRSVWYTVVDTLRQPVSGRTGMGVAAAALGCAVIALMATAEHPQIPSHVMAANTAPAQEAYVRNRTQPPVQDLIFVHDPYEATQVRAYSETSSDSTERLMVSPASSAETPLEPLH